MVSESKVEGWGFFNGRARGLEGSKFGSRTTHFVHVLENYIKYFIWFFAVLLHQKAFKKYNISKSTMSHEVLLEIWVW